LVNGKRIGGASGVAGFPPEALARLAILPPAAAARLGYAADQRVVNLVLKNKFASWEGEVGATLATAGGRDSERVSVSRVVIDGATYWNAQVQLSRDSMLFRSARALPSRSDPVDLGGHVTGISGQGIDPALSLIAGREVTIVGFPSGALAQSPKTGRTAFHARAWHLPMYPVPIKPTPMVSICASLSPTWEAASATFISFMERIFHPCKKRQGERDAR